MVLMATSAFSQDSKADQVRLTGPVKSLRVETALVKGKSLGAGEQARHLDEDREYDRKGNLVLKQSYYNGSIILSTRYIYSPTATLMEEISQGLNGALIYRREYKYSAQGRLAGETICRNKPEFFEIKRPAGVEGGVPGGIPGGVPGGVPSRQSADDPPPPPPLPPPKDGYCAKLRYVYDSRGKIVYKVMYESTYQFPYKDAHDYDLEGNLIAVYKHYDILKDKPSMPDFTYKYDANGNLIEEAYHAPVSTTPLSKDVYAYDSEGRIISKSSYDSTSVKEKLNYKYEFDSKGNWIKRIESALIKENGQSSFKPIAVVYRTISYYSGQAGSSNSSYNGVRLNKAQPSQTITVQKLDQSTVVERVNPAYPPLAKAGRIGGQVEVEVTIDEQGYVVSAKALSGHELLKPAAVAAAWGWIFSPPMVDGVPSRVVGKLRFNFNI
jgi:TonB family protein